MSDEQRVHEVTQEIVNHYGKMDILVHNAGLWRTWKPFVETTSDKWKKRLTVLEIACEQKKQGADIVKRVTAANSDEEQMENVRDHFDYLPDIVE